MQVHAVDQALTFTSGIGKATINGKDQEVKAGDLMVVPAGTQHQFVNTGPTPLVRKSLSHFPTYHHRFQPNEAVLTKRLRSSTQSTPPPSTTRRRSTKRRRKAIRKRRVGRMRPRSGASRAKKQTRRRAWSGLMANTIEVDRIV